MWLFLVAVFIFIFVNFSMDLKVKLIHTAKGLLKTINLSEGFCGPFPNTVFRVSPQSLLVCLVKLCWRRPCRVVFRNLSNIYDKAFYQKLLRLLAVNYFLKKTPPQIFDWVLNAPLPCAMVFEETVDALRKSYSEKHNPKKRWVNTSYL